MKAEIRDGYLYLEGIDNGVHIISNENYVRLVKEIEYLRSQVQKLKIKNEKLSIESRNYEAGVVAGYLKLTEPNTENK